MFRDFIYGRRAAIVILVIAVALVPFIAWGGYRANLSNSNDVRDWLPHDYPETQEYRWFTQHFGSQDFILASWPGCTLDDERLDAFVLHLKEQARINQDRAGIGEVYTGRSLLEQMTAPPMELSRKLSISRLRGVLVGPDNQQTCAVIMMRSGEARQLEPSLELIRRSAESIGVPRSEVRMGGIPVINAALNRESTNSLIRQAALSGLLGLIVAWFCFRNVWLTLLVLVIGVFSAGASLAVVPVTGVPLNAVLITMVPLVYVAAVSGAIHLTNYYLAALEESSQQEAPGLAVAHAVVPLLLAAVTTILGLLSLGFSDLHPIQLFGIFSAVGVGIGFLSQFLLLPAALIVWKPGARRHPNHQPRSTEGARSHLGIGTAFGKAVVNRWPIVLSFCLIALTVGAFGLPKLRTSIQLMRLFSPRTPVIPMTRWLEERLGATIPLEVVVLFRPESRTAIVDRMRLVAAIDAQLQKFPGASGCLSAATFVPPALSSSGAGVVRRAFFNTKLTSSSKHLREAGWIAREGDDELWRISLRVRGIDDLDYAAVAKTIRDSIDPLLDKRLEERKSGVDIIITGTAPIVFKARQSLLDGMLFGLTTDVVLIVVGVILITRNLLTGVIMLLLSVFPTAIVFGSMGFLDLVVDIGSVMTPCIALGVTVDDVIHFLLCHRQQVRQGMRTSDATLVAYDTCGRAIVQSWGVIGIGLAAFALSSFVPTFRFGVMMLLLLTAGMFGNLLFLPSLLTSPLGRWMTPQANPNAAGNPSEEDVSEGA